MPEGGFTYGGVAAAVTVAVWAATIATSSSAQADPATATDQRYLTEVRYVVGTVHEADIPALISWGHRTCSKIRSGTPANEIANDAARKDPAHLDGDKAAAVVWAAIENYCPEMS